MKGIVVFGLILILAGICALAWPAITYTKTEKVADLGPIQVTKEDEKRVPIPAVAGGAAVAAGIALVVVGSRRR
jgi:uncharacterized membrane protein HdeD (DUF308 family)